ncbi:MAG: PSD1 and planctomycete cytochrome C domain-containing protein [Planctomycetales bacterium]
MRFNEHVRPILAANCFACHGMDAGKRQADLRLDLAESAFAQPDGAPAIKPGDPSQSELWRRIISDDPAEVMPPPASKKQLSPEQKELLRRWIEQGAPYQRHWAYEVPTRRQLPAVRNEAWVRNPVDRFVLSRLEREPRDADATPKIELLPQPEADRPTLIRRVSLALTGLPPTVAQIEAYLRDESSDAYERMVDRYLRSPHFGEEMARHWLDVARYADTHGLHLDNERQMWLYRDWVVRAFNDNLPFDQFTTWQLAGDLLPDPSHPQLIATGYNRCNVTTSEGGSIDAELVYRYAVDRTSNMLQTWMGLTGGCAQCHDHKYDPLTTKEFYSLYAFFYSAADPGMDGNVRSTAPFLKVPSPEQAEQLARATQGAEEARKRLEDALPGCLYRDPGESPTASASSPVCDDWLDDEFPWSATVRNTSRDPAVWLTDPPFGAQSGRRVLELANSGLYDVRIEPQGLPLIVPRAGRLEAWLRVDPRHPPTLFAIQLDDGKQTRQAVWGDPAALMSDTPRVVIGPVPAGGEWVRLVAPFDKLGIEAGARLKSVLFYEHGGRVWLDGVQALGEADPATDPRSSFLAWWRDCQQRDVAGIPSELREPLKAGPDQSPAPELRDKLRALFLAHIQRISESPVADLRRDAQTLRVARATVDEAIPGTFIFRDLEQPRPAFVMLRGQYDKPGDPVEPGTPAAFAPLRPSDTTGRATRLDLARWLLAPEHPLTARVAVNRLWQQMFGTGLVKTSDDFGMQGEPPSHPELLDWLALEFRDQGWNVKQLVRLLVTSATFRQQARQTPELQKRDPENRLLARGPRFRLDAEQVRDQALFASGLIDLTLGGRGVKLYQPANIWEPVGYADSNTRFYLQDHGSALYRRSLYSFLKRTAPPPFMSNFDGPNREQSCARRERSNTPLQALQLLNDVQQFEAARGLAERVLREGGRTTAERAAAMYRLVLSRVPDEAESALVAKLLATERALYEADPAGARAVVHTGESTPLGVASDAETAAWTMVANLILNLDETLNRN